MKRKDPFESQSLMLIAAAMVGHVGNYAYHLITGRLLSTTEYGLLMALFGLINILLIPMSALGLALTRTVAVDIHQQNGSGLPALTRNWARGMILCAGGFILFAWMFARPLQTALGFNRVAPILLAACIPGFNLLLTLCGALLQGLQQFKGLALRGSMLFVIRALLVSACLLLGWRAAGWALLAHLLGMCGAFAVSVGFLWSKIPKTPTRPAPSTTPILYQALKAFPILLAFSTLMTADVILARSYFPPDLSGRFAQAATLGRMILWLPLPIAQVLFPKVVRENDATPAQRKTLRKAMGYTVGMVVAATAVAWIVPSLALRIVFGIANAPAEQIFWFRGVALAMAPLGPVYLLMQYELARGKIQRMLPLCLFAPAFLTASLFFHESPRQLILLLMFTNLLALISALPQLFRDESRH
ncbi:hypothetical protein P0Y35_15540 [Kiritimatiellaeota bacterium B1221]|nr:hypothetical protein [Kiritimatiellaeota bacterium B1221]